MQVVHGQHFGAVHQRAKVPALNLQAKPVPATDGDVGALFVAAGKRLARDLEMEVRDGPRTGPPDRCAAAMAAARSDVRWSCADTPSRGVSKSWPMWNDRPAKPRSSGAPLPVSSAPISASIVPSVKSRCTMAKLGPLLLRVLSSRPACSSSVSSSERQSRPFQWRARGRDQVGGERLWHDRFGPARRRAGRRCPRPWQRNPVSSPGGPRH